jgi:hypothetical protein
VPDSTGTASIPLKTIVHTKTELVVEAVEGFVNAIIDGRATNSTDGDGPIDGAMAIIIDERKGLSAALLEFLTPMLRIHEGGRQGYADGTPESEKPKCLTCGQTFCCKNLLCPDWHAAIRKQLSSERDRDPNKPDGVRLPPDDITA